LVPQRCTSSPATQVVPSQQPPLHGAVAEQLIEHFMVFGSQACPVGQSVESVHGPPIAWSRPPSAMPLASGPSPSFQQWSSIAQ
jgi:hypothetical protein